MKRGVKTLQSSWAIAALPSLLLVASGTVAVGWLVDARASSTPEAATPETPRTGSRRLVAALVVDRKTPDTKAGTRAAEGPAPEGWGPKAPGRSPIARVGEPLPWVDKWLPEEMRCETRGRRRFCNGPRRIAAPVGVAAARAQELGLGTHRCAAELIRTAPRREWLREVEQLQIVLPDELVWPIDEGRFGRGVGFTREDNRSLRHRGVDVMAPPGAEVRAVADALVAYADNTVSGYGNLLVLLHGDGAVSMYAHLASISVFPGQVVRGGQTVARVGATGLARGPHLHLEWREDGTPGDPMDRFPSWRRTRRPRPSR